MVRVSFWKIVILLLVSVLLTENFQSAFAAQQAETVNLITNPIGQGNYTISVAKGQVISKHTKIRVFVQPTQGPLAIPGLLEKKDGVAATLSSVGTYWAYTGTGEYSKPYKFIRVFQSGNPNYFGLLTREGAGIKSIADLKGKRITYFVTSLLTLELLKAELRAYDLDPTKDITLLKAENTPTALQNLVDKRTDAISCALGGSKMAEYSQKTKLIVLPFHAEKASALQKQLPTMFPVMTPATLSGIDPGIPVVATSNLFMGRADLDEDLVYRMVKALIENYDELKTINPVMADWKPEVAVQELPIPYHPGAIKYYREKGLWSTKMDELQQKLLSK